MSDHNSVDLDKLKSAIDTSSKIIGADGDGLRSELRSLVTLYNEVLARCEVQKAEQVGLTKSEALLDQWASTDEESQLVYDEVNPHQGGGLVTFDANPILEKLETVEADRSNITADPGTLLGMPPTSGYADDPVCTANGNFVHQETDITFNGFAELLNVQRTYNSLSSSTPSFFGLGWSSMLDMSVTKDGDELVRVRMADGADVPFFWDARTQQFGGQERLGLTLRELAGSGDLTGWELVSLHDEAWRFDTEGRLSSAAKSFASCNLAWSDDGVVASEQLSGRSVRYTFGDRGRVRSVTSSDGRKASFGYDSEGHCCKVDRPTGAMVYIVNGGRVESVVDADDVVLVTNTYDRAGRVVSQTNEHGSVSTYEYMAGGMTRVTYGPDKPANLYGHDQYGNLTSVYGGDRCAMRMSWDDRNRLTHVVERSGAQTFYEYSSELPGAPLVRRVDPDGLDTTFEYDESGRVVSQTGRDNEIERYAYDGDQTIPSRIRHANGAETIVESDGQELPVSFADADGVRTQLLWDNDGQLVSTVSSSGARTTFVYDKAGWLARVTDRAGVTKSIRNDVAGRIHTMTNPDGVTSAFTYTAAGRVLACDADGPGSWNVSYTPSGVLDSFVDSVGARTSFVYDEFGRQVSHSDSTGATWSQAYDPVGRIVKKVDPLGATTSCEFGRDGHVRVRTEPGGARTEQTVNNMGQTTQVSTPDGLTTHWAYHPNGEIASVTDPEGHQTTFDIDAMGRLLAETGPDGGVIRYGYTPGGRLRTVTSAAGRQHTFRYDQHGQRVELIDPDGRSEKASYGPDGRLTEFSADGSTTSITYDEAGRVNGWSTPNSGETLTATLTPNSAEVSTAGNAPSKFAFDMRQRLISASDPTGVVTEFTSNDLGQLSEITAIAAQTAFTYNAAGEVVTITDPLGVVTSLRRTQSGAIESVSLNGEVVHNYTYDTSDRITDIAGSDGETLVAYEYDHRNLLVEASNRHGSVEFVRDLNGRITESKTLADVAVTYARDADGIVTRRTDGDSVTGYVRSPSGAVTGFVDSTVGEVSAPSSSDDRTTDIGGRVVADRQGRTHRYDPAGRLVESLNPDGERRNFTYNDYGLLATDQTPEFGHRSFTYDLAGAVKQIVADVSADFGYDQIGRRVSETRSDGTSVRYVWNDLSHLVQVIRTDASDRSTTTDIVYSAMGRVERVGTVDIGWDDGIYNKPIAIGQDRYLRWGTQVRRCEPDAEWSDGTYNDPFGLSPNNGEHITLGYRGELTINGLVFMGDRVYDPATRSFLSRDPLPSVPGKLTFAGVYSYAYNDPINNLDPTGRQPLTEQEFQSVRENLEKLSFEDSFLWEHRDIAKSILVGAAAIAAAAVFCGATAGIGCVLLAGAAAGATAMVVLDEADSRISEEEVSWKDRAWSASEGAVVGAASAFGGTYLAHSAPIGLIGNRTTIGSLGIVTKLARHPVAGTRMLANPTIRRSLVRGAATGGAVDGGLTFTGKTALDTIRSGPRIVTGPIPPWVQ